jgi:hypothetical protein
VWNQWYKLWRAGNFQDDPVKVGSLPSQRDAGVIVCWHSAGPCWVLPTLISEPRPFRPLRRSANFTWCAEDPKHWVVSTTHPQSRTFGTDIIAAMVLGFMEGLKHAHSRLITS